MRYNRDTCAVELSVEELCQRTAGGGDLGGYVRGQTVQSRLTKDEIHTLLQRDAKGSYHSDADLSFTMLAGGMYHTVSGRADGWIRDRDGVISDTLAIVRDYGFRMPPEPFLLFRMQCYAYALAIREDLSEIRTRITYLHAESKKVKYFFYRYQTAELCRICEDLLERIVPMTRLEAYRQIDGLPSAASASFPYPQLREGQEIMIREIYGAIRRGQRLFVEAPTGTGKTVSALYPAVRALGEGRIDKIFYLTAKASTAREAYRGMAKLSEAGVKLKTVVIAAKDYMCANPRRAAGMGKGGPCGPDECENAHGYYDRVNEAVCSLLGSANGFPTRLIRDTAKQYGICPYELSLDLSEHCDVIICDYNYAFDPLVYFRRYFSSDAAGGRYVFLIDEAHNLADRARDMYSAILRRSDFERVAEICREDESLSPVFAPMVMCLSRLRELCREDLRRDDAGNEQGFYMNRAPLTDLNRELETFEKQVNLWLKKNRLHPFYGEVRGLMSDVKRYLAVNEYFDRGFLCYVALYGGDTVVKTYCLDPSPTMDALLNRAHSAILFSATLTPPEYFCEVLGGSKRAVSVSLPSPFDPGNLCVAVADYLSLRMEDRKKNYVRYATALAASVSPKAGNYIAYFPSYECLEGVLSAFRKKYPKVETVVQKQGMGRQEREDFLAAFQNDTGHLRIGFCVLGGAFSEGVDLPGSRLIGSVIFGVGLPGISNERNIIEEYFNETVGEGYDYAYTYPGMNRVLQAVGRVIRRDSDRGVAILIDDRYATPKYRHLFPTQWQNVQYAGNASSLAEIVRRFWENQGKIE